MKLIVESGATKSTWVLVGDNGVVDTQVLAGINPTNNPKSVDTVSLYEIPDSLSVEQLFFYGAGASSMEANASLEKSIKQSFGNLAISIEHDILAAARSVSANQPSIVSILGTGSNTCVYDGLEIVHNPKAMGYIFADYGSGFYLGKLVVRFYFEKLMSQKDEALFEQKYMSEGKDFIYNVYAQEKPNFYVAQFTYFLSECSEELRSRIVKEAFSTFYQRQILPIKECKSLPLNFVGSVSSVFEKELRSMALEFDLRIDRIMGNPIDGLIEFHQNN